MPYFTVFLLILYWYIYRLKEERDMLILKFGMLGCSSKEVHSLFGGLLRYYNVY